ncbi:MAG: hypothetical protein K0S37_3588 [Microbacterium sp.]|jgi:hypothetical protein|nr:hypothetical protein [Microbacterium sp.]
MPFAITETAPQHPPLRRTVEAEVDGYNLRATASAHWQPETNDYAPFRVDGTITVTTIGGAVALSAQPSQLSTLMGAVDKTIQAIEAEKPAEEPPAPEVPTDPEVPTEPEVPADETAEVGA